MAKNRQLTDVTIKYLIYRSKGPNIVIEVPAKWKITFGSVNPQAHGRGYTEGFCVRLWEGEKLRAVFNDCLGFRDMSIPYAVEIKEEVGNTQWRQDSEGNFSDSREIRVSKRLVPGIVDAEVKPDNPDIPF